MAFVAAAVVAAAALVTAGGSAVGLAHAPAARSAVAELPQPVRPAVEPEVVGATDGKELAELAVTEGKVDIGSMRSGRRVVDAPLRAPAAPSEGDERPARDRRHDASSGWCTPCHDPFRGGVVAGDAAAGKTRAAGTASAHRALPTGMRRAAHAGGGKTSSSSADQSTSSVEPPAS